MEILKCPECTKTFTKKTIFDFEINFWHLHENFALAMTPKVHVILDHFMWYFGEMGINFYNTNGKYVEAVHYSLDGHEEKETRAISASKL